MTKKVKVLELLPGLNYGGSQAMIINLCSNIDYDLVQCDFIIDHGNLLDMKELVESFGANVYVMPSFKGLNIKEIIDSWNKFFYEHDDYDIIHCHIRSYAHIILRIARKHGLKIIIHSHNTSNGKGLANTIKTIMQYPLRRICDYYFACSLEAGKWLFGERITKSDKFYVINNAIDTDKFTYDSNVRKQYREMFDLKDERVFIQVGRMSKQKNYMFTLDLFKKYLETDDKAKLFIVGDGELDNQIRERISELLLDDNIIILQHRDDVHNLLQMADVFLMPSVYEGLSVACIEAQSSGILCLCSDKVDQNVNVTNRCQFIKLDIDEWIDYMKADISDRRSYKQEIIDAGFDARTNAKWLENFYKSII